MYEKIIQECKDEAIRQDPRGFTSSTTWKTLSDKDEIDEEMINRAMVLLSDKLSKVIKENERHYFELENIKNTWAKLAVDRALELKEKDKQIAQLKGQVVNLKINHKAEIKSILE